MKVLRVFCLYCLSFGLLSSVSAEPFTTEKIVFSSNRNGNSEIYTHPNGIIYKTLAKKNYDATSELKWK